MKRRTKITTAAMIGASIAAIALGAAVSANAMDDSEVPRTATVRVAMVVQDGGTADGEVVECEYSGVNLADIAYSAVPVGEQGMATPGSVTGAPGSAPVHVERDPSSTADIVINVAPGSEWHDTAAFGIVAFASPDGTSAVSAVPALPTPRGVRIVKPAHVRPGTPAECDRLRLPMPVRSVTAPAPGAAPAASTPAAGPQAASPSTSTVAP